MNSGGTFFLRSRPYEAHRADGVARWILPLMDRHEDRSTDAFLAVWTGDDASEFVAAHRETLVPGAALRMTLTRPRARNDEMRWNVVACELAPARWASRPAPQPSLSNLSQQAAA